VSGCEGESRNQSGGIGPVVGEIFWEERRAEKLAASENRVRIRAGKMGEGPEQIELRLLGDKKEKFRNLGMCSIC
jgi:hypothetical protein